jgi:hypothetical protein
MAEDNAGGIMRSGSPQFKEFKMSGGAGGGFFANLGKELSGRAAENRAHERNIELGIIGHVMNMQEMSHKTKQTQDLFPGGIGGKFTHKQGDVEVTGTARYAPATRKPRAKPAAKPAADKTPAPAKPTVRTTTKPAAKPAAGKTPAKPAAKAAASPKPRTPRGAK